MDDKIIRNLSDQMEEFTSKIKDVGRKEIIDTIEKSMDYHHKATNVHARIVVRRIESLCGYELMIQSNVKGEQPKPLCRWFINFEQLFDKPVKDIMNEFFAKHVLDFILQGTTVEESLNKTMGVLNGYK